jgi:hypothetical protein
MKKKIWFDWKRDGENNSWAYDGAADFEEGKGTITVSSIEICENDSRRVHDVLIAFIDGSYLRIVGIPFILYVKYI